MHVLVIAGLPYETDSVILDGLIITGGNANGYGSVVVNGSNINRANGGGVYTSGVSTFRKLQFRNCTITNNRAINAGGGMNNEESSPDIIGCAFLSNRSENVGGGVCSYNLSSIGVASCLFYDNVAINDGGALFNQLHSNLGITASTLVKNTAQRKGGAICLIDSSDASITNNIIWNNTSPVSKGIYATSISLLVQTNIVQGGYSGIGNLNTRPYFRNISDPAGADGVIGSTDDGLALQMGSPAINAGDNNFIIPVFATFPDNPYPDVTGSPRIVNSIVDLGAYEYHSGTNNNLATLGSNNAQSLLTKAEPSVSLYPNPAMETAVISINNLEKNTTITLTDLSGKVVWRKENVRDKIIRIPVANITSGTYLVTVRNNTFSKTLKLIKQ